MAQSSKTHKPRPWTFYPLAAFFGIFVLFLYGPMFCIYILSFQGPNASLVFPMQGVSIHWFEALFGQARTGDVGGAFARSLPLSLIILSVTVLFSVAAGLALTAARLPSGRRFTDSGLRLTTSIDGRTMAPQITRAMTAQASRHPRLVISITIRGGKAAWPRAPPRELMAMARPRNRMNHIATIVVPIKVIDPCASRRIRATSLCLAAR